MTSPADEALPDWRRRAAALADELVAAGTLRTPAWRAAITEVPRHVLVPRFFVHRDGAMVPVAADDEATAARWRERVYANTALVTEIGGGEYLSSSSTPGLMTRMLDALDVREGHRVLEIGTGTGYNAALLCHRLGDDRVVSVDVEPGLVDLARARLAAVGHHPTLVVGDGAEGVPATGVYDRVIATCSVPRLPWAWVDQTALGGVVLADVRVGTAAGNLVRLTRTGPTRAEGSFDAGQAAFMALRHAPGAGPGVTYTRTDDEAVDTRCAVDPRTPWTNSVVWFLATLAIGQPCRIGYTGADPRYEPDAVSVCAPDGSRAEIALNAEDDGRRRVREWGPTRLWRHVQHAHQLWEDAGRPAWSRWGLTVTPGAQTLWLDDPENPMAALPER